MEHLYMFAIMPPVEIAKRIRMEQEIFAEKYNCAKALKPPVHITIYEPFKAEGEIESTFCQLHAWAAGQKSFGIELNNYNYFKNRRSPVVYIDVVKNDSLRQLHTEFRKQLRKYMEVEPGSNPYTPHFTIAYRDVSPEILPAIIDEYKHRRFHEVFACNSIFLWRHDGKNWQIIDGYKFGLNAPVTNITIQSSLF